MKNILIKTPQGEMDLKYWSEIEYKRIILIMKLIEDSFDVDLNNHPDIRKNILDTGNFIRRLPDMIRVGDS